MFGWFILLVCNGIRTYSNVWLCIFTLGCHTQRILIPFHSLEFHTLLPPNFQTPFPPYSNPNSLFLLKNPSRPSIWNFLSLFFNLLPPPSFFFNLPSPVISCSLYSSVSPYSVLPLFNLHFSLSASSPVSSNPSSPPASRR